MLSFETILGPCPPNALYYLSFTSQNDWYADMWYHAWYLYLRLRFQPGDKQGAYLTSASGSSLIDVRRSSGISGRSALAFALSISCQTMCMFEGTWTSRPFHSDEWLFSSVLHPCYEKGDLGIERLYEAIKNVCQSAASNAIPKERRRVPHVCVGWAWGGGGQVTRARMVKKAFY